MQLSSLTIEATNWIQNATAKVALAYKQAITYANFAFDMYENKIVRS